MRSRVLSEDQITLGKQLRSQGRSKAYIARMFEVGKTTVWEHIFATTPRVRIHYKREPKPKIIRTPCASCEINMTRTLKGDYIPMNFQMGDKCIVCYLEEKGLDYITILRR